MKYCLNCGRITPGEPMFCQFCGRSYDVKLCPSRHPNPRSAEVCSRCGSRDLSTPQPRISCWWKAFAFFLKVGVALTGVALGLACFIALLQGLLSSPQLQAIVFGMGILTAVLWWIWSEIPDWVKKLARWFLQREKQYEER